MQGCNGLCCATVLGLHVRSHVTACAACSLGSADCMYKPLAGPGGHACDAWCGVEGTLAVSARWAMPGADEEGGGVRLQRCPAAPRCGPAEAAGAAGRGHPEGPPARPPHPGHPVLRRSARPEDCPEGDLWASAPSCHHMRSHWVRRTEGRA